MRAMLSIVLLLLFVSVNSAQGPIPKGTFNLDGTISFTSTSSDGRDDSRNSFQLNPQVGYFIIDNLSFGLSVTYSTTSIGDNSTYHWAVGPAARYYLNLDKIYPFIGLGYSFSEMSFLNEVENIKSNQLTFSGGFDVFITESVAIETLLSYMMETQTFPDGFYLFNSSENEAKSKTIFFGVGINVFI